MRLLHLHAAQVGGDMVIEVTPRPWWARGFDHAAELVIFVGVGLVVAGAAWAALARVLRGGQHEENEVDRPPSLGDGDPRDAQNLELFSELKREKR